LDSDAGTLSVVEGGRSRTLQLWGPEAFQELSRWWLKMGWANRHSYNFTWFGRPIIQLPEDMVRLQELVTQVRPDVVVETGIAHGGSAVFFASLLEVMGRGRVVSVDIEIRPHNRAALEAHPLRSRLTLIEGSSIDPAIVAQVRAAIRPDDTVLVVLDSNHTRAHVAAELELYAPLVSPGSYVVATDGVMADLSDVPGGKPEWREDNPLRAADDFLAKHPEFERDARFDASAMTYFPGGYLRRRPS
jgi:cephalosporin hydroxylase